MIGKNSSTQGRCHGQITSGKHDNYSRIRAWVGRWSNQKRLWQRKNKKIWIWGNEWTDFSKKRYVNHFGSQTISPRDSNENEEVNSRIDDLQNKLREEKEQNQEKLNRLQEYLATKFDDFDSTIVSSTSNKGSGDQRNENSNGIPSQEP